MCDRPEQLNDGMNSARLGTPMYRTGLDENLRSQLMREGRCFACRQRGHRISDNRCSTYPAMSSTHDPPIRPLRQSNDTENSEDPEPKANAMQEVTTTVELIERVLVQLPPDQLLKIGRTCKQFDSILKTSPTVQLALWQRASSNTTPSSWIWDGSKILADQDAKDFANANPATQQEERKIYAINPLLLRLPVTDPRPPTLHFLTKPLPRAFAVRLSFAKRNIDNATNHVLTRMDGAKIQQLPPYATCPSMQLTDPPVCKIIVVVSAECSSFVQMDMNGMPRLMNRKLERCTIEKEAGMLFRDVVEVLKGGSGGNRGTSRSNGLSGDVLSHLELPGGFPITETEMREYKVDLEKTTKIQKFKEEMAALVGARD
ncbi:hypothetical protein CLAFUW4_09565 [Fulvia fulva]|uniref:F-box domain-containing protein n=1 Tax=Passalora fulva TaxID=5499 RepID=A0A9Q8PGF5_PASFU|nr:uncharacterized protein CLAFUR5_09660 [Fulvia fulva]KAK4613762.1 hypothetical protein CLAFUR4_09571 [Fulvia fulva]UJO21964.1 hypothetical protein CLAFUR5_09660 [Fulvia fulva]WPV20682.1 hypothetical protein CLAFUW4_09565 [Fulvia fulva]WPV34757.1 hypothetical protein CLAFUW7_09566 [Fulvia fulva]